MGNQVKNGRNYKNNIIKLSLNSFSTNSAIHDNFSSCNNKKIKNFEKYRKMNEPNFSKVFPFEKISNISENKQLYNNNNINSINKESIKTINKNSIYSEKNKIILLSSYSLKTITKRKNNIFIKNNIQHDKPINKIIHNELHSKKNNSNQKDLKNIDKEKSQKPKKLICDIFKEFNKQKKSTIKYNRNKFIDMKQMDSMNNNKDNKDNKSSVNSSKFINFDIINEKISIIDGIDSMNLYDKNNNINHQKKDNKNDNNQKDNIYEIEFEDYIKKLNLEEVNIDEELLERPLLYRNNILLEKNSGKKINDIFKSTYNIKKNRNSDLIISDKNSKTNKIIKKEKINKFYNFKTNNRQKNKIQTKNKINNIYKYPYSNQSGRGLYFNEKKNISTSPNSKLKFIFRNNKNNLVNINESSSISNKKKLSKRKENQNLYMDYLNFKKIINDKINKKNNIQLTDLLLTTKSKNINIKSKIFFQTSNNSINFKRNKSELSSKYKYNNRHKDIYRSVNLSNDKYKNISGNLYELNTIKNKKLKILKNNNSDSGDLHIRNKNLRKGEIKNLKINIYINKKSSSNDNIFDKLIDSQRSLNKLNKIDKNEIKSLLYSNNNTINNKNKSYKNNVKKMKNMKSYYNVYESSYV